MLGFRSNPASGFARTDGIISAWLPSHCAARPMQFSLEVNPNEA
jgi:hypothetical protein